MPFEPKTDSKEFEIANLDPSPTAAWRSVAAEPADLTIRIWRGANADSTALTWSSESVLVYMIADLVAASHGQTAVETQDAMSAHFDNSLQAVVAAKRIQGAILEFLSCRPGDCMGAAILLHPLAATGFSPRMAQSALRLTEPGQIILAQEIARRLKELPGIELRPVPALTTGGSEHVGLAELVWTSAERLAALRSSAPAAPTTNIATPYGATMIVNAPLESSHARHNTGVRSREAEPFPDLRRPADGLMNRRGFEEALADLEEHQSFITPLRAGIGAMVIVIVIVGLVLFHPWSGSKVAPQLPRVENSTAPTPARSSEPPAVTIPQPPPVVAPEDLPPKPPVTSKPPATAKDKEKVKKPEDAPIKGFEGNSTYDGMTQKDIPRLLQWARSDAGNGNYAKAAQEYRVILQLQPSNPDAREGLRKIQVAQGRDQ